MGLGHISRCLALAEILSQEFHVRLATSASNAELAQLTGKASIDVFTLPENSPGKDAAHELGKYLAGDEIIVLDGYHFSSEYESQLKGLAGAVVFIDDIPSRHTLADVVINFCGALSEDDYSLELYTRLFTGLEYLFLRSPFLRNPPQKTYSNRLFINMGGTDPENNTLEVLRTVLLSEFTGEIVIVVGAQYKFRDTLKVEMQTAAGRSTLHIGLSAEDIYHVMSNCALAILPPSTVCLEYLSTGGLAFLHQTAHNQSCLNKYLQDINLALRMDDFGHIISSNKLAAAFESSLSFQKKIFNGGSIGRLTNIFRSLAVSCSLSLRQAGINDVNRCFDWANDPEVRKYSYSSKQIQWDQHVSWFQKKINDPGCIYFIASIGAVDVGQIRFDLIEGSGHQISYSLDKNWRGKGLSPALLLKAVQALQKVTTVKRIVGFVRNENIASVKAFQRAGFGMAMTDKYPDSVLFQLPR